MSIELIDRGLGRRCDSCGVASSHKLHLCHIEAASLEQIAELNGWQPAFCRECLLKFHNGDDLAFLFDEEIAKLSTSDYGRTFDILDPTEHIECHLCTEDFIRDNMEEYMKVVAEMDVTQRCDMTMTLAEEKNSNNEDAIIRLGQSVYDGAEVTDLCYKHLESACPGLVDAYDMELDETIQPCHICKQHETMGEYDDKPICQNCAEMIDYICYCDKCKTWVSGDDFFGDHDMHSYCNECAENNEIMHCQGCHETFDNDSLHDCGGEWYCEDCAHENDYERCECGEHEDEAYTHIDQMCFVEGDERWCKDCVDAEKYRFCSACEVECPGENWDEEKNRCNHCRKLDINGPSIKALQKKIEVYRKAILEVIEQHRILESDLRVKFPTTYMLPEENGAKNHSCEAQDCLSKLNRLMSMQNCFLANPTGNTNRRQEIIELINEAADTYEKSLPIINNESAVKNGIEGETIRKDMDLLFQYNTRIHVFSEHQNALYYQLRELRN